LSERVEVLAKSQAEKVQDICEQMKTLAFDIHSSLQDGTRSVLQVQAIAESTTIEASSRLKQLEDRIVGIDSKVCEIGNRENLHYDELQATHRTIYSGMQELRLEDRSQELVAKKAEVDMADELKRPAPLTIHWANKTAPMSTTVSTQISDVASSHLASDAATSMSLCGPARGSIPTQCRSTSIGAARSVSPPTHTISINTGRSASPSLPTQTSVSGLTTPTSPSVPVRRFTSNAIPVQPANAGVASGFASPPTMLRLAPRNATPGIQHQQ
jgi:hypothetical protein